MHIVEVEVLNGLKIKVAFTSDMSEPLNGHKGGLIDWSIVGISGRFLRKGESADWLYKRIEETGEESAIIKACLNSIPEYP